MKILLYSTYSVMPNKEILDMKIDTKTCLFCAYADEASTDYIHRAKTNLSKVFEKIIDLTPDFKFNEKIDCVFMNGGNVFELIYKLKKYNQFAKIKKLIKNGTLYIGNSAGSEVCADDVSFINEFEPPKIEMNVQENCKGFGFVDKKILVEAGRYTLSRTRGLIFDRANWHNYFVYKRKQKDGIKIANNAVVIIKDGEMRTKKYPWKKLIEINKIGENNAN